MTAPVLDPPAPRVARRAVARVTTTAVAPVVTTFGVTAPQPESPDPDPTSRAVAAGTATTRPGEQNQPDHPDHPDQGGGWAELMRDHRADLVRIARLRLRRDVSGSDAEDVVHEVFLRVVRLDLDIDTLTRPVAYLRRAVANECATRWRRHRELAVEETPDAGERDHADPCAAALTVRDALGEVSPRQRAVLVMGYLQGYTDAEIAATLGIEPVTVRTLRRRGLERLRTVLGPADEEPSEPAAVRPTSHPRARRSIRSAKPTGPTPSTPSTPSTRSARLITEPSEASRTEVAAPDAGRSDDTTADHRVATPARAAANHDADGQGGGRITRRVPSVRSLHGSSRYAPAGASARAVPPVPVVVPMPQLPDRTRVPA